MRIPGKELEQPGEGFLKLARRDLNPDLENQNLSCYQLHHGLIMGVHLSTVDPLVPTCGVTLESPKYCLWTFWSSRHDRSSDQVPS